ncbi:MAG: DUF5682 family protein [Promethearchaeota archaeon]
MIFNSLDVKSLENILFEVCNSLGLNIKLIHNQISKVKRSNIKYLPIRHHSPSSTILVKKWIEKFKPKLVLIEGPSLIENLFQYIVAADTFPPIAILSIFADINNDFGLNGILSPDPSIPVKFEIFYPYLSYSPELVALTECISRKIPVHFIDLPLTGLLSFLSESSESKNLSSHIAHQESIYFLSTFYQKITQIFEFDSFNETWETLFEISAPKSEINQLRESILLFCSCVRQTIDRKLLNADGTLERESYMKYQIENYIKKHDVKEKDTLVITGGIHSVVLPDTPSKDTKYPIKGLINSLIPFSYFRLSNKSGYLSGNQAPQFYENIWDKLKMEIKNPYEVVALEIITDIFKNARQDGYVVSISDSINAFQGAKMLAMLRRRIEPGLKDIIDAIHMILIKGNPQIDGKYLEDYIYSKTIGYKVGKITKKIGRLPLQEDFYFQLESLGISLEEKKKDHSLNLRKETDIKTSYFFWRIKFLAIDFLERVYGPDIFKGKTGIFTEVWSLYWTPSIDVKLVELSAYGSTVEEASYNKLIEEAKKNLKDFNKVSNLLFQSLLMGFTNQFKRLYTECLNSIEIDNEYLSLSQGFLNLFMIYQYLSMMGGQKDNLSLITKIIHRCYYKCCYSIPNYANPPTQDEEKYIQATKKLANALNSLLEINLDLNAFIESIKICISSTDNEFIKGGNLGILYLMNKLSLSDIKIVILEYLNSIEAIKVRIGDLIRGIIYVCQAKILFNKDIVALLSEVVENIEWDIFTAILPVMRKTFSELEPREYEIFVEKLAEFYGLKTSTIKGISENIEDEIILFFRAIDKKVKDIFELWFGEI